MTATDLAAAIRSRKLSAREATDSCLARIDAHDQDIGAFTLVNHDQARRAADRIDALLQAGEDPGPLAGIPVAVKDNIAVADQPCTCASRMLHDFKPPYSAHVVEKLLSAGAVIVGRTNMDEFAMGSSTENSGVRITRNPWARDRVPGGSSGGSAAAVAAGFVALALGSDTGGSIRQPAGFCGVVGMKPSYGMVSRYGLVAFGSSLDQIGPMARTTEDAAMLLACIAGHDPRDATSRNAPPPDFRSACPHPAKDLRIGLPREYFAADGLAPAVRDTVMAAVDLMREQGASVHEISLPTLEFATAAYYIIATAEASSNLARYDGVHYGHRTENPEDIISLFSRSRSEAFGPEVKRRIMLGTYVLSAGYYDAYYLRALRVRTLIARDFDRAFAGVDIIISPTSPTTAFGLGEKTTDPVTMYLSDIYTVSTNLAALPALSIPCGRGEDGLPVGMQIIAPRWHDDLVLRGAAAYEHARGNTPDLPVL